MPVYVLDNAELGPEALVMPGLCKPLLPGLELKELEYELCIGTDGIVWVGWIPPGWRDDRPDEPECMPTGDDNGIPKVSTLLVEEAFKFALLLVPVDMPYVVLLGLCGCILTVPVGWGTEVLGNEWEELYAFTVGAGVGGGVDI